MYRTCLIWIIALTGLLVTPCVLPAVQAQVTVDSAAGPAITSLELGIRSKVKLGAWAPLRVTLRGAANPQSVRLSWRALDGEGVWVRYEDDRATMLPAGAELQLERTLRIGRSTGMVVVELLDDKGQVVSTASEVVSARSGLLPSSQWLIAYLGPESGFSRWAADRQNKSRGVELEWVELSQPQDLPLNPLGLDGLDLLVVATDDPSLWTAENAAYWQTVETWVSQGGRLILLCGSQAEQFMAPDAPLANVIPGKVQGTIQQRSSAGAEMFVSAKDQLLTTRGSTFTATELTDVRGEVLAYEGRQDDLLPLVVRDSYGMGSLLFVAVDLNAEPFSNWNARPSFVAKLMTLAVPMVLQEEESQSGRLTHMGYDNLAGQLRLSLDRFDSLYFVTFTWVSVLVVGFILLIGPLDYVLVRFGLKRMELTWLTSGITILVFCFIAVILFNMTKGTETRIQQAELIDVDIENGNVRGTYWGHLYTPSSREFDLSLERDNEFSTGAGLTLLTWQGLSGTALGGMDASLNSNRSSLAYTATMPFSSEDDQLFPVTLHANELQGIPMPVASTRPLTARWWDKLGVDFENRLYQDRRNNSLRGDFTNPFPYTLDQAVIYFDNWAYVVSGDIQPGETIAIEGQTIERTLEYVLLGRDRLKNSKQGNWDATDESPARILEVLSFYEATGGRNYSSLSNRMHHDLDWSHHLSRGKAVLLARIPAPISQLQVDGQALLPDENHSTSLLRVLLPVATE